MTQKAHFVFEDDSGTLQVVELSLVMGESITIRSDVTSQPIEDGSVVTDHLIAQPDLITIQGIISNQPLEANDRTGGGVDTIEFEPPDNSPIFQPTPGGIQTAAKNAAISTIAPEGLIKFDVLQFPEPFDLIRDFYEVLNFLKETRTAVTLVTNLREYPLAGINEVQITRAHAVRGEAAEVSITLQELRTVSTQIVEFKPREKRAFKPSSKGQKTTKKSAAAQGADAALDALGL